MKSFQTKKFKITVNKHGSPYYSKASYPLQFGMLTEIETDDYIFRFDLDNRIKIIRPKNQKESSSINELFKRNCANDWIYYCTAGYKGVFSFLGEYYLPCFDYSKNPIFDIYGYDNDLFDEAFKSFSELSEIIKNIIRKNHIPHDINLVLENIITANQPDSLKKKAEEFHEITSGRITVLPPDCRHVDYDVIPLNISTGCIYNCDFCSVKNRKKFKTRNMKEVLYDIKRLKDFYSDDIINYNSLFLGENDALNAGAEIIIYAAKTAYQELGLQNSYMKNPILFLFGSVDSLINAEESLFEKLNELPFYTYINIGIESADDDTLRLIKKPLVFKKIKNAFEKMMRINKRYINIEITANFVMGDMLSEKHYKSITALSKMEQKSFYGKGAFYISPLQQSGTPTEYIRKKFLWLKNSCIIPVYIYIIQML